MMGSVGSGLSSYDHKIDAAGPTAITRDGRKVRITIDDDHTWIQIGCTRVSVYALNLLHEMVSKQPGRSREIVLQEGA